MVDGVCTAIFACHFLRKDFEVFGYFIDLGFITAQRNETRIECGYETRQDFLRIAFRINGDEQHLQFVAITAQLLFYLGQIGKRRGTNVGALRESKKQRHHLAAIIRQGSTLPSVVG